jgi:hypothetical protein
MHGLMNVKFRKIIIKYTSKQSCRPDTGHIPHMPPWCSYSGIIKDLIPVGCDDVSLGKWFPKFHRIIVPSPPSVRQSTTHPQIQHYTPDDSDPRRTSLLWRFTISKGGPFDTPISFTIQWWFRPIITFASRRNSSRLAATCSWCRVLIATSICNEKPSVMQLIRQQLLPTYLKNKPTKVTNLTELPNSLSDSLNITHSLISVTRFSTSVPPSGRTIPVFKSPLPMIGSGQLSQYSDLLRAGRSGDRNPVGARFSAPVQTGPGAYTASYAMGTRSFLGVKHPGHDVDHPPPSSNEVKERVELYIYSPSGPLWRVLGWTLPYFYWLPMTSCYLHGYSICSSFTVDVG